MNEQFVPATQSGLSNVACSTTPPYMNLSVEQVKNGFIVHCGWDKHIANDKAEVLSIITDFLK